MATEVSVPALGESVSEATVAKWFKKLGDLVKADEPLCELETDKVSVEAPAPVSGVLVEIRVPEGDVVQPNGILAVIDETATAGVSATPPAPKAEPAPNPAAGPSSSVSEPPPATQRRDVADAPSAQKLMAEAGLAAGQVQGSGRDGRVMKEDVLKAVQSGAAAPAAAPAPAPRPASAPTTPAARSACA